MAPGSISLAHLRRRDWTARSAPDSDRNGLVHGEGSMSMIAAPLEHLDLATVLKVSQAVSGEMSLEKLLDTLMRTAVEHAGAERALLMLAREVGPRIAAEA